MIYKLHTIQFLTIATGLAVVSIVVYTLLFLEIKEKNREASLIASELDLEAKRDKRLRSIQNIVRDTEQQREQLNIYFVNEDSVVTFIETIEALGGKSGAEVEIVSVNIEERNTEEGNSEFLRLTFSATGTWNEVFYLFSLVELLPYKIEIKRASFESRKSGTIKSNVWNGSFSIAVAKSG
ncbi:hypothetical protein IIB50_00550 [Patescibacteria group bacterium]|nr:hypothetical protein [Patescibacteria group bacterium]